MKEGRLIGGDIRTIYLSWDLCMWQRGTSMVLMSVGEEGWLTDE